MKALRSLIFITLLTFIYGINSYSFASVSDSTSVGGRDPKKFYLQIDAKINDSKGPEKADEKEVIKGAVIKVMNDNNYLVASYFSDKKGKVTFQLPLDKKYKVIICKKGYVTKIVDIDSTVPKEINNAYVFKADVAIFAEVPKLNTDVLLKPISRIRFDKMKQDFDYDQAYTHKINTELKKMYKEYYTLKKAAAQD